MENTVKSVLKKVGQKVMVDDGVLKEFSPSEHHSIAMWESKQQVKHW